MKTMSNRLVHPENMADIEFWCNKWGVNRRQLYDAILHTGSLKPDTLKAYLKKDNWFYHPLSITCKQLHKTIRFIF